MKAIDYVAGWLIKASEYSKFTDSSVAFVTTNSICQGGQASILWPLVFEDGLHISFAHLSFKWSNLASHNAGVSVIVVGLSSEPPPIKKIYELNINGETVVREVPNINAYLLNAENDSFRSKVPIGFSAKIIYFVVSRWRSIHSKNERDQIIFLALRLVLLHEAIYGFKRIY